MMRSFLNILFCIITLISCAKSKVEPVSVIKFDLENQYYEKKLNRSYKIQIPQTDLYINGYGFSIDTFDYQEELYLANIHLVSFVYYHTDSIEYKHDSSRLEIRLQNIVDSTMIHFSSQICGNNSFELIIDQLETSDNINGYYSARFEGTICDSSQVNSMKISSGKIIRARL